MRGTPKYLNSKFDYEYIKDNMPEHIWRPQWENLLRNREIWVCTGEMRDGDVAVEMKDGRHKIEEIECANESKNGKTKKTIKRYFYELREDPSSDFVRLGFTEEEVKKALEKG